MKEMLMRPSVNLFVHFIHFGGGGGASALVGQGSSPFGAA